MTGYYYENILLSFDMHNEVFQTILTPKIKNMEKFVKTKVFAEDSVVLFVYPRYDFNFDRFEGYRVPWLCGKSDGVVLILKNYSKKQNKLIFYDCCTRNIRRCFEMPEYGYGFKILEHKGSLIAP